MAEYNPGSEFASRNAPPHSQNALVHERPVANHLHGDEEHDRNGSVVTLLNDLELYLEHYTTAIAALEDRLTLVTLPEQEAAIDPRAQSEAKEAFPGPALAASLHESLNRFQRLNRRLVELKRRVDI